MKKIFVAYANDAMAYSLKRIGSQAKSLNVFDEVLLMTPKDLPSYITESELMKYEYGGGYWAWKPCVIWETLQRFDDGDVVCYVDAGCSLKKTVEWDLFFKLMYDYDNLCFKYDSEMPCWGRFGNTSTKIKFWTKSSAMTFYNELIGDAAWGDSNKVWGGCVFAKGRDNILIKTWLDVVLQHPEVIIDPAPQEKQISGFALHKHDQSLLTALCFKCENVCVLPELSETCGDGVAIYASRIRAKSRCAYWGLLIKKYGRKLLGEDVFSWIKRHLSV